MKFCIERILAANRWGRSLETRAKYRSFDALALLCPFLLVTPLLQAIAIGPPCQSYSDGREDADRCLPGLSPTNRVGQAGRCEAKQAKTPVSTLPFPFFCTLEAGCGVQLTESKPPNYQTYSFESMDFIASLTLCFAAVQTRTARSKVRQAGFARKVYNGAKPRVQVLFTGIGTR